MDSAQFTIPHGMPAFRFLLGSRLYDTMGFDDFEAQFSQKYRYVSETDPPHLQPRVIV